MIMMMHVTKTNFFTPAYNVSNVRRRGARFSSTIRGVASIHGGRYRCTCAAVCSACRIRVAVTCCGRGAGNSTRSSAGSSPTTSTRPTASTRSTTRTDAVPRFNRHGFIQILAIQRLYGTTNNVGHHKESKQEAEVDESHKTTVAVY